MRNNSITSSIASFHALHSFSVSFSAVDVCILFFLHAFIFYNSLNAISTTPSAAACCLNPFSAIKWAGFHTGTAKFSGHRD